jgi:beta-phosphoglucomutase
MNKKAFIFDLDGVIVDTARYHFLGVEKKNELPYWFTLEHNELKGVMSTLSWSSFGIGKVKQVEEKTNGLSKMKNNTT